MSLFVIPINHDATEDVGDDLYGAIETALCRSHVPPLGEHVAAFIAGADWARGCPRRCLRAVATVRLGVAGAAAPRPAAYTIADADDGFRDIGFTTSAEIAASWLVGYYAFRDGDWTGPAIAIEEFIDEIK